MDLLQLAVGNVSHCVECGAYRSKNDTLGFFSNQVNVPFLGCLMMLAEGNAHDCEEAEDHRGNLKQKDWLPRDEVGKG